MTVSFNYLPMQKAKVQTLMRLTLAEVKTAFACI